MQKIDLHQNIIHSFEHHIEDFGNNEIQEHAGNLETYKNADLQIVWAVVWPYLFEGNEIKNVSEQRLNERWQEYENMRKKYDIKLISSSQQLADTKYIDFQLNFIYHLSGGDTIQSIEQLEALYNKGFRSIQFVSRESNHLAHHYTSPEGGLSELAKDLIQWMDIHKMIIDTANMNYQSMLETYEITRKPIMNSHTNIDALSSHDRNIGDDMLDLIDQSNGIIGLSLSDDFVNVATDSTIDDYITQIGYIRDRIGDDNIAFGSSYHSFTEGKMIKGYEKIDSLTKLEERLVDVFGYKFTYRFFWENAYRFLMETI